MVNNENAVLFKLIKEAANQRYDAMAVKLAEKDTEISTDFIRPLKTMGKHIALCQAFAMARREGKMVYMEKKDHWCWAPLVAFGHIRCERGDEAFEEISRMIGIEDIGKAKDFFENIPRLPHEKYTGIMVAPLAKAPFTPDIILVNCNNAQLRTLLLGIKSQKGALVESRFDPIDSCVWSIIPSLLGGDYRITLPDPGDYARALTDENDIILSIPKAQYDAFTRGLEWQLKKGMTSESFVYDMEGDFARPPFYNKLYSAWGLDQGKDW
ncbi:DUF169 domain-containing protein [Fusibacter paucivorans]|uniref:DUF169 domain-containing protein n=1 Tax=Fusibacter paucivorans TaxID=76009 RepID=A0ABS5PSN9_9FIRM|nr:DUF169 domain-containing protein [Fusibacter paucivorans]MBS7528180.1 DUF169 domain-containing protein [Fusibacter paucivorans]